MGRDAGVSTMNSSQGQCPCGDILLTISLPGSLDQFSPRKCDCEFCTVRNISYLSHPDGLLEIATAFPLTTHLQGSMQAAFLLCPQCRAVLAASYRQQDQLIGALNSTLLRNYSKLRKATPISPRLLSPDEKVARWKTLWMPVTIRGFRRQSE
ncbi:MAG: aldehyde-activating protein [Gammaproteobacteria bacterium]|nr:aldehyde-activating protein [Gammaproteobacteria bacterium]